MSQSLAEHVHRIERLEAKAGVLETAYGDLREELDDGRSQSEQRDRRIESLMSSIDKKIDGALERLGHTTRLLAEGQLGATQRIEKLEEDARATKSYLDNRESFSNEVDLEHTENIAGLRQELELAKKVIATHDSQLVKLGVGVGKGLIGAGGITAIVAIADLLGKFLTNQHLVDFILKAFS